MAKDRERSETMSLEQYLQFFESRKQLDLTMKLLNEIILMHGFKRIHKVPKKVLIDAIDAIELMDPSRSTLAAHTSLPEAMKLEEVIDDLKDLSWQECCVTSVQTLNSHRPSPILSRSASATQVKAKKKLARPRKTLRSVYHTCASTSSSSSSGSAERQLPRNLAAAKRNRTAFQRGGGAHAPSPR